MSKGKVTALVIGLSLFLGLGMWGSPVDGRAVIPQPDVRVKALPSYKLDIQPVLDRSCAQCHRPPAPPAGLDLTSYGGIMKGTPNGLMVIPGHPDLSNLIAHLKKEVDPQLWQKCLLKGQEVTPNQAKNLEQWIKAGARDN